MNLQELDQLCAELLDPDCERSAILAAMSDDELQQAMCDAMRQFGLELLIGAEEKSTWMGGLLLIRANLGPILDCQAAFRAILIEMSRRNLDPPEVVIGCQSHVSEVEERRDGEE